MEQLSYIGKTLKQDETDKKPWSMVMMKEGETK